ncbi:hypothetical protein GCM10028798_11050 [Humibacter antri]
MTVIVRDECPDDRADVDRIISADIATQFAAAGIPEHTAGPLLSLQTTAQREQHRLAYPHARFLVLLCEGLVVGRLVLDGGDVSDARSGIRIVDIAVAPEARRTGVARTALRHVCREADARQVAVELAVWADNTPAIRLYRGFGFGEVGSEDSGRLSMRRSPRHATTATTTNVTERRAR